MKTLSGTLVQPVLRLPLVGYKACSLRCRRCDTGRKVGRKLLGHFFLSFFKHKSVHTLTMDTSPNCSLTSGKLQFLVIPQFFPFLLLLLLLLLPLSGSQDSAWSNRTQLKISHKQIRTYRYLEFITELFFIKW